MVALLLGTGLAWVVCYDGDQPPTGVSFPEQQASAKVSRYEVLELSFQHNGAYRNNFFDVDIEAAFKSLGGVERRVKGILLRPGLVEGSISTR